MPLQGGGGENVSNATQQQAVISCLERLKPGHFQAKRMAYEIRDLGFTPAGALSTLQLLVRGIYVKAVADPDRCAAPCASLCYSLTPILPTFIPPGAVTAEAKAKRIDFRGQLLNLCQREFEVACTRTHAASPTSTPKAAGSAEQGDQQQQQPSYDCLSGVLQFLAWLYLHHLLTDRIMLTCLAMVASPPGACASPCGEPGAGVADSEAEAAAERKEVFAGSGGHTRLAALVRALVIAGRQLHDNVPSRHRPMLDDLYDKLRAAAAVHPLPYKEGQCGGQQPEYVLSSLHALLACQEGGWVTPPPLPPLMAASVGTSTSGGGGAATSNGGAAAPERVSTGGGAVGPGLLARRASSIGNIAGVCGQASSPRAAAAVPAGWQGRRSCSANGDSSSTSPDANGAKAGTPVSPATPSISPQAPIELSPPAPTELNPLAPPELLLPAPASDQEEKQKQKQQQDEQPQQSSEPISPVLSTTGSEPEAPSGASPALPHPTLKRIKAHVANGPGLGLGPGGSGLRSGGMTPVRGSYANLDGLWNLSQDNYSEARAQLLAQPVAGSPATLEAMADELVECAIAASGGDPEGACKPGEQLRLLALGSMGGTPHATRRRRGSHSGPKHTPAATAGAVAGGAGAAGAQAGGQEADWAQEVQEEWREQQAACELYVRLCVDAMTQLGNSNNGCSTNGSSSSNGNAAAGGAAAEPVVSETGRTFRRLLLSAAQLHFERCLADLLPPVAPVPLPSPTAPLLLPGQHSNTPSSSAPPRAMPETASASAAAAAAIAFLDSRGPMSTSGKSLQPTHGSANGCPAGTSPATPPAAAAASQLRAWSDIVPASGVSRDALPRARGVSHLLVGLLRGSVLTPRIVLHCAAAMVEGAATGSLQCLECAVILLAGIGQLARTFKVAEAAAYESLVKRLRSLAGGPDSRDGRRGGGAAGAQQQQQQQHQGGQHGQGQAHGHGLKNGGGGGGGGGGGRHGGRGRRHTRGSHDGTGGAEGKDWREGREGQGEGGEAEMRRRYVRLLAPPPRAPPAVPRG